MLSRISAFAGMAFALGASAHDGRPEVRVVFDGLDPPVPGVVVQVYDDQLAPQAVVENRSGRALEILDDHGAPFLRIGPDGVQGNLAAYAWYRTASPSGAPAPKTGLAGDPRWQTVRAQPAWGWFDPRLAKESVGIPRTRPKTPVVIGRWEIPARIDGREVRITGHFRHEPQGGGGWRARLASGAEPASGVRVVLSPGQPPGLMLENLGTKTVTVIGAYGEPFLRINADGVEANLASASWQDQGRYRGLEHAPATGPERWMRVSPAPRYTWIEPRALGLQDSPRTWTIPLQVGDRLTSVSGVTEWTVTARD